MTVLSAWLLVLLRKIKIAWLDCTKWLVNGTIRKI
jgi:hypothetical protein